MSACGGQPSMHSRRRRRNNEDGYVMVSAIMVLMLLTLVGFTAMDTSTTESSISTNVLLYERAFYTSEAGMQHVRELLSVPFIENNATQLANNLPGSWTFALDGSMVGRDAATDINFDGGVLWIDSQLGGVPYQVTIWDNDDGDGRPDEDADGLIFARSTAADPRGTVCSIETLLEGDTTGQSVSGYKAQAGAGAGKNYRNDDLEAIDFTDPSFGNQL